MNPAFTQLTGYTAAEAVGQNPRILNSGRQNPEFYRDLWETILAGRVWHGELINRRKAGDLYTEEMTIAPVRNPSGAIVNFVSIKQDVTERKRAEEQRAFLASIVESSNDAIVGKTLDGTIVSWNKGAEFLYGYSANEVIGKPIYILIPPGRIPEVRQLLDRIKRGETTSHFETVRLRKDGTSVAVSLNISPLRNDAGEVVGASTTARDISERTRAEEALRTNEERFRQLADNIREVVFMGDLDPQRVTYISPAYEEVWQRSRQDVYSRPDAWIDAVIPQDRHRALELFEQVNQGNQVSAEYRVMRGDGSVRTINARLFPVRNAQGRVYRFVGIAEDVTNARQVVAEIMNAKNAAEGANRAKTEFLANMSHEIRTPMNGIMGMIDLVLDTALTSDQRELLKDADSSAESLMTLLNNILDLSKVEAGKLVLESVPFNLRDTLNPVMKACGVLAANRGLEFKYSIRPDIPEILIGDPGKITQVLNNLVGNAIKFTDHGGVFVEVARQSQNTKRVCLSFSVRDTGIGIPAEKQAVVFDAFTQADSSTTRRHGGSGLGLTISRRLVSMMGGELSLDSVLGAGSTFRFTAVCDLSETPQKQRSEAAA